MAAHNELGKEGEDLAALHLMEKGYRIRHRNWRSGKKEIDIVAEKDGELVIVEVKTRGNENFGRPEDPEHRRLDRRIPPQVRDRPAGEVRHHYSHRQEATLRHRTHRRRVSASRMVNARQTETDRKHHKQRQSE